MKTITAKELDEKFDNGEDISEYLDWSKAWRGNENVAHTDVELRIEIVHELDQVAQRLGVSRADLISRWIEERLNSLPQQN